MTKTKKALMGLTALLMAFSMTALTACTNTKPNDNNGDKPGTEQGGNEGGNQGGTTPGGTTTSAVTLDKVMEASAKQTVKGASFEFDGKATNKYTSYESDADGVRVAGATDTVSYEKDNVNVKGAVNLTTMETDSSVASETYETDKDGNKIENENGSKGIQYSFMRGGNVFYASSKTEITDWSKEILICEKAEMPPVTQISGAEGVMGVPFNTILNLAKVYNASSITDKKVTVNFNKVVYGLYNEVLGVIDGLTETSKVGEVVESAPVKNLLDSLTYGMTAKEFYDELKTQLGVTDTPATAEAGGATASPETAMIQGMFKLLPVPAEGATLHTYIVTVLKSKDFAEAVMKTINPDMPSSAIAPLYDFTVLDVIKLVMANMGGSGAPETDIGGGEQGGTQTLAEQDAPAGGATEITVEQIKTTVKTMLNEAVKVTEDKVTISMGDTYEVSGLTVDVTVSDKCEIVSASVTGGAKISNSYVDRREGNTTGDDREPIVKYYATTQDVSVSFNASISLSATEPTLTDIGNSVVLVDVGVAEAGKTYYTTLWMNNTDLTASVTLGEKTGDDYAVTKFALLDKVGGTVKGEGTDPATGVTVDGVKYFNWSVSVETKEDHYGSPVTTTVLLLEIAEGEGSWGQRSSLQEAKKVSELLAK